MSAIFCCNSLVLLIISDRTWSFVLIWMNIFSKHHSIQIAILPHWRQHFLVFDLLLLDFPLSQSGLVGCNSFPQLEPDFPVNWAVLYVQGVYQGSELANFGTSALLYHIKWLIRSASSSGGFLGLSSHHETFSAAGIDNLRVNRFRSLRLSSASDLVAGHHFRLQHGIVNKSLVMSYRINERLSVN